MAAAGGMSRRRPAFPAHRVERYRTSAENMRHDRRVIVSLHVATGAALGAVVRSRPLALLLGPPLHVAGDRVPHEDIPDRSFEIGSGLVALALLAARRGPLDPAVLGGAAASMPDLEHIVPSLRVRGEKVFHRGDGRHGVGISAERQLLLAGAVVGLLLARRR
jgi:hypothetical protein